MLITFVIVNGDLQFHMHNYNNSKYVHIWWMLFKKQLALLFLLHIALTFFVSFKIDAPTVLSCENYPVQLYIYD